MENEVYTVAQLATKLEITERTISDALRDGKMQGYKKFNKWFVTHEQLLVFLASQEEPKPTKKKPSLGKTNKK